MNKYRYLAVMVACLAISTAFAKDSVPPSPTPRPDLAKVRMMAESGLKSGLFDPASAQIVYTSGFQWGFAKPLIGKRTWGWIACVTVNAKNRMGGYVGAEPYWILSDANGSVTWAEIKSTMSTCDNGQRAELQSELTDAPEGPAGNAKLGVAEELGKLAALRDKGIITSTEFDEQKQKLLGR